MGWSLYEKEESLEPLEFSNGKTQESVVSEVLDLIKKGEKIIFIHGVCGTGKSAIALNVAKELGRASVVVPIKNLQKQYSDDYSSNKYLYKDNEKKERLKIAMITGRSNHPCQYLKDNLNDFQFKEKDSSLIEFSHKKERKLSLTADNSLIPCKISIDEANRDKLKKYFDENPNQKKKAYFDIENLNRVNVAPACLYWSPILPSDFKSNLDSINKLSYQSINGEKIIYQRKPGCSYYRQFLSYKYADVIIFNSRHYLLETYLGRKPATDVEIIDECDEFLDNFAEDHILNLDLLSYELGKLNPEEQEQRHLLSELKVLLFDCYEESSDFSGIENNESLLTKTKLLELVNFFINNDLYKLSDDDNGYLLQCIETCRKFEGVLEETYASFSKSRDKKDVSVRLITINLSKTLNQLLKKNKVFVMMSGTIHSEEVLRRVFGIEKFSIVEAETVSQGEINKISTGYEADFKYDNFQSGRVSRVHYLKALNKALEIAKRPTLVHVNSFADLPTNEEKEEHSLEFLETREELKEKQKNDLNNSIIKQFKSGEIKILFTTKCNRGVDFPGEMCNSVVLTKFPYPDSNSLFWKIFKKQKPELFWSFYKDKARRELLQKIYRSVRSKDDKVDVLSPDIRVLEAEIV